MEGDGAGGLVSPRLSVQKLDYISESEGGKEKVLPKLRFPEMRNPYAPEWGCAPRFASLIASPVAPALGRKTSGFKRDCRLLKAYPPRNWASKRRKTFRSA